MDLRSVVLLGATGVVLYYLYKQKEGDIEAKSTEKPVKKIDEYHKRALLSGHAVAKGERGAARYVTQSRQMQNVPSAQGRSYLVTRAVAAKRFQRNKTPGGFFTGS